MPPKRSSTGELLARKTALKCSDYHGEGGAIDNNNPGQAYVFQNHDTVARFIKGWVEDTIGRRYPRGAYGAPSHRRFRNMNRRGETVHRQPTVHRCMFLK